MQAFTVLYPQTQNVMTVLVLCFYSVHYSCLILVVLCYCGGGHDSNPVGAVFASQSRFSEHFTFQTFRIIFSDSSQITYGLHIRIGGFYTVYVTLLCFF